jgi:hypothetical protein
MFALSQLFHSTTFRNGRAKPKINRCRRPQRCSLSVQPLENRIALSCDGFLTYSQGGWSGPGVPGSYLDATFSSAFPDGVQIGDQAVGAATSGNSAGS